MTTTPVGICHLGRPEYNAEQPLTQLTDTEPRVTPHPAETNRRMWAGTAPSTPFRYTPLDHPRTQERGQVGSALPSSALRQGCGITRITSAAVMCTAPDTGQCT